LITVEGGKWTTSRHLAEKVVDHLATATRLPVGRSISARRHLQGCVIGDLPGHLAGLQERHPDCDRVTIDTVGRLYGEDADAVLNLSRNVPDGTNRIDADGEIMGQAVYAVRYEMARTLADIVLRRTGIATLGCPGEPVLRRVAAAAAEALDWDDMRIAEEVRTTMETLAVPVA
jgi:glycerol-3-phosphate dehydrogenase